MGENQLLYITYYKLICCKIILIIPILHPICSLIHDSSHFHMNDKSLEKDSLWEKLKTKYRIGIADPESLKELRSFQFSLLGFVLSVLGLISLVFLFCILLFSFKPIKHFIFGIDNVESSSAFIQLNQQVIDLEQTLTDQRVYIDGLVNMLNGDQEFIKQANPQLMDMSPTALNTKPIEKTIIQNIEKETNTKESKDLRAKLMHLVSPVRGRMSAPFNALQDHLGVDIIAPKNSPIVAVNEGVVINAAWTIETGNTISIQHSDNIISVYKHNSVLLKKEGDYVTTGEAIAIIGNSGEQTTGPHLHFELWFQGVPLDPVQYISF